MKKILGFLAAFFALTMLLPAETGSWKGKNYSLEVFYNGTTCPGDAVFMRMVLTPDKKTIKDGIGETSGTIKIIRDSDGKTINSSKFYQIHAEETAADKNKVTRLLSGVPLSSYAKTGKYTAKVEFTAFGKYADTFSLPVEIKAKDFVSETIPLDAKNTSIKTNTGSKRMSQINRLNEILGTTEPSHVYSLETFKAPNPATRRTSFFADRRIYAYSNGKSSTSLHYGIDYGVPTGSEVRACSGGKVVMAEDRVSTGWSVCIEHLPGLYSLYYHMSKLEVKEGDMVTQGQLIGLSGATGLATGPHLHWEVRLNMEAVSPDFFTSDFTFEGEGK